MKYEERKQHSSQHVSVSRLYTTLCCRNGWQAHKERTRLRRYVKRPPRQVYGTSNRLAIEQGYFLQLRSSSALRNRFLRTEA